MNDNINNQDQNSPINDDTNQQDQNPPTNESKNSKYQAPPTGEDYSHYPPTFQKYLEIKKALKGPDLLRDEDGYSPKRFSRTYIEDTCPFCETTIEHEGKKYKYSKVTKEINNQHDTYVACGLSYRLWNSQYLHWNGRYNRDWLYHIRTRRKENVLLSALQKLRCAFPYGQR